MFSEVKKILSIILSVAILLPFCSCGNQKYKDMKSFLNSNTELEIKAVSEWICNEETKAVSLYIKLAEDSDPSLEELDGLRTALNEYMQRDGGYLEQSWQVSVIVDEQKQFSSAKPDRYAVLANFEQGCIPDGGNCSYETSDILNTFWFNFDADNASYISSLIDVEHIYITSESIVLSNDVLDGTIEELRGLGNLKTLRIDTVWYERFSEAGLDCEVIEYKGSAGGL